MRYAIFCLLFASCGTFALPTRSADSELLSVVVIFRHGDYVPIHLAPLDPYGSHAYWPADNGELTNRGIRQTYDLGNWMRERYGDFLPSTYVPEDIFVRSATADRCLMSAESFLAGLYPPGENQTWNEDLLWQPIPVRAEVFEKDTLFEMASLCPQYQAAYKDLLQSEYIRQVNVFSAPVFVMLQEHLGASVKNISDVAKWYETMNIEDSNGFELPAWTKEVYPDQMKTLSDINSKIPSYGHYMGRFASGVLLEKISTHFEAVIVNSKENKLAEKMAIFSGQQNTICDLTNSLKQYRSAPVASAVIFELRNTIKTAEKFVNVIYKDTDGTENFKLKNCGEDCQFEQFLKLVEPLRLNDTEVWKECLFD